MSTEQIDSVMISCQYLVLIFFQRRQVINCIDKILMVFIFATMQLSIAQLYPYKISWYFSLLSCIICNLLHHLRKSLFILNPPLIILENNYYYVDQYWVQLRSTLFFSPFHMFIFSSLISPKLKMTLTVANEKFLLYLKLCLFITFISVVFDFLWMSSGRNNVKNLISL